MNFVDQIGRNQPVQDNILLQSKALVWSERAQISAFRQGTLEPLWQAYMSDVH